MLPSRFESHALRNSGWSSTSPTGSVSYTDDDASTLDAVLREALNSRLQVRAAVAEIRPQAQVAAAQHGPGHASRQTSTETSPTGSAIGGSGLAALTHTAAGLVALQQVVGDGRAETLEGAVAALLGDEPDSVADLAVVDGVLDPVCDGRVGLAYVEPDVDQQSLPDFPFCLGHAHAACTATGR